MLGGGRRAGLLQQQHHEQWEGERGGGEGDGEEAVPSLGCQTSSPSSREDDVSNLKVPAAPTRASKSPSKEVPPTIPLQAGAQGELEACGRLLGPPPLWQPKISPRKQLCTR